MDHAGLEGLAAALEGGLLLSPLAHLVLEVENSVPYVEPRAAPGWLEAQRALGAGGLQGALSEQLAAGLAGLTGLHTLDLRLSASMFTEGASKGSAAMRLLPALAALSVCHTFVRYTTRGLGR